MARSRGPLKPSQGGQWESALAWRWRRLRDGVPSGLFLFGSAVTILLVGVLVGLLLAKVASHDAFGRADTHVDRWFAAHRTNDLNQATHYATDAAKTPTIAALAALTAAGAALTWRRWREPMLVAVVAPPASTFPSGHTAAAVALDGAWALLAWQRSRSALLRGLLTLLATAVPIAVARSRMYRGMHDPTDVLAGVLVGTGWLAVTVRGIRHHELRAETAEENPARRWPLPRHG
jgi:membrane-associated phospholipid phosphatase